MKLVKSQNLVLINRIYEEGKRRMLFVGVGVGYFLDNPATPAAEKVVWTAISQQIPAPQIFDAGFPKPAGEIIIAGSAAAPERKPVRGLLVTAAVGPVRRRLAVFGNRTWRNQSAGPVFTEPAPFISIPLVPQYAYGGEGHPENPLGIGHGAAAQLGAGLAPPLPNIEDADNQIRTFTDQPEPAIPGSVDLMAPSRQRYAGTYDQAWLRTQHPGFPTDVDSRLFHAAQPKQRLPTGFFTGQERFEVAGMHPDHPHLAGTLPDLRPRAFIRRRNEPLHEVALRCETVTILGSALIGIVMWRGQVAVAEQEASDVEALMVGGERFGDEPRSMEHYRDQFQLRTDKETAGLYAILDRGLMPDPTPEAEQRKLAARAEARAEIEAGQKRTAAWGRKQVLAQIDPALHPLVPETTPAPLPEDMPVVTQHELETGDVDIAAIVEFARKQAAAARQMAEDSKETVKKGHAIKTAMRAIVDGERPDPEETLAPEAVRSFQDQMDALAATELPKTDAIDALLLEHGTPEMREKFAAVPQDPLGQARAMMRAALDPPPPTEAEDWEEVHRRVFGDYRAVSDEARQQVIDGFDQAKTQLDSAQTQITAKLDEERQKAEAEGNTAIVEKLANISLTPDPKAPPTDITALLDSVLQTRLPAAPEGAPPGTAEKMDAAQTQLDEAMAGMKDMLERPETKAILQMLANQPPPEPMDLDKTRQDVIERMEGANRALSEGMAKANAARRVAPKAIAPQQPVSTTSARKLGQLAQARHSEREPLAGLDFAGLHAPALAAAGADAAGSFWEKGALAGADFTGANLENAVFAEADLASARFAGANLAGANFAEAKLAGADLSNTRLEKAVLSGIDLGGANFDRTRLEKSSIIKAGFARSTGRGMYAENTIFIDTDWSDADIAGARFERCMFIRGSFARVRAQGVQMHRCAFVQIDATGIDLSGAQMERVIAAAGSSFKGAILANAKAARTTWMQTDLTGANFAGADLTKAGFLGADLTGARLRRTILRRAMLNGATLTDTDLRDADLFEASLRKADLRLADLRGANLWSADLTGATMHFANLTGSNLGITLYQQVTRAA